MGRVNQKRVAGDIGEREVVLFLIGMRVNQLWRVDRWFPVATAMPRMIVELMKDPSRGLLSRPRTFVSGRTVCVIQYWNSFEDLERYARASDAAHLPAWRSFNRRVKDNGTVGIWHETYRVTPGSVESVYVNMPDFGLAQAVAGVPAAQRGQSAAMRLGLRDDDTPPVAPY